MEKAMSVNRDVTEATADARTETAAQSPGYAATEGNHMTGVLGVPVGQFPRPFNDELKLIILSQQGDAEAFARLYDRYVDRIYRYVLFRVPDDRVAEDITSHVFIKMWEKLPMYQIGHAPFTAWLYRIAHNAVIDQYRTRKTFISLEDINSTDVAHDDNIDEKLDLEIKLDQLREALKELTDGQRQVLILRFIEGFRVQEIARQLGKSQGAVRALQMRALRQLARAPDLRSEGQSLVSDLKSSENIALSVHSDLRTTGKEFGKAEETENLGLNNT